MMANARGYDVSDYQSSVPADAQFVFIKASEGGRTGQQGYAAKITDARNRGLVVGHYHFIHCENPVQGEVDHFCRVVGDVPASELLVLDFEPYGQPVSDSAATAAKNAWLAAIKARYPNNRVGLYTSVDWWHRTDDNAADFLWIADYVTAGSPRIQAPWRFHQYSDTPLDCDVYNGTLNELRAWAGASAPPPAAPSPAPWPGLQLVTREQWDARPWLEPNGSIPYAGSRLGVKVHYLGAAYAFGDHSACPAYVRRIQAEHMDGKGWSDIGYSFVVCEHGYTYEGRGLNRRNSANGDVPLNELHYAVCALLGSSGSTEPTVAQLNGLRDVVEYCRQHGPAGPEIKGHRDGYQTDCPGGPLYSWVQAGAPRPTTPITEDDMPLTGDDADNVAHSVLYWLAAALGAIDDNPPGQSPLSAVVQPLRARFAALPADVWNHPLPNIAKQADGSWGPDGTTKSAYWWLVWQDPFQAQLLDAIKASTLSPEQLHQALADGLLRVQVTVATASDTNPPKGTS